MVNLYRYLRNHKWLLYTLLVVTVLAFGVLALQCRFEENIAKLLPPTDENKSVDLAFSELKVKDKIFVQVLSKDPNQDVVQSSVLIAAMDLFMEQVQTLDQTHIDDVLYEIEPTDYLDLATYLALQSPTYFDFTDEEFDTLFSIEHLTAQISQYRDFLETDLGSQLYDFVGYDPAGILLSHIPNEVKTQAGTNNRLKDGHLFSSDGKICQGFIAPHLSSMDSGQASKLLKAIKKAKNIVEKEYPQVEILYHGTVIQSANNAGRIKSDLLYTIGIALLIIIVLLGWCFRQPISNILVLLTIGYGALFALAGMFVVRSSMSVMALGIGAIVLGVALSYCLHVMIHFKYIGNASQTVKEQAVPVFLGALTTIGAFAGLLFTSSSLLQDFGLFAVFAMIGTTFAALVFMPHFFPRINKKNEQAFAFLEKINEAEIDRKNWVLILMLVFVVGTIIFSPKVQFDPDLKHINYTDPQVLRSNQLWAQSNNEGCFQQYFASVASSLDEALQNLKNIENECEVLQKEGLIKKYTKTSVLMPSLMVQQKRIEHWYNYFTPNRSKTIWNNIEHACRASNVEADIFLPFQELMQTDLQPDLIAESGLIPQSLLSNLVEQVGDNYLVFMPVKMAAENVNEVNGRLTKINGCMVLDPFYYTIDTVAMMNDDFNTILGISALFVLVVLLFSFRRLSLALIAFLPMTLSWYVVLGAMYLTGHEFNLINIVVSSFIFGIGVDYSIFIMDGMLGKARGENPKLLTYHKTAITISATILVICMFSLLFAVHPAIRSIGFASLVGMITTMMLSYTLEPWLFRQCMRSKWLRKKILAK